VTDPKRPPVVISMSVEGFSGSAQDTYEVPRDEWDAMTPAERVTFAEGCASDHAANYIGWGWHIADPDDYASTEGKS
jgi:hypothetical protein